MPADSAFTEVYRAANHAEVALIRARLDGLGIRYYVNNELATLGALSAIGTEQLIVMVETGRAAEAAEVIREIVEPDG